MVGDLRSVVMFDLAGDMKKITETIAMKRRPSSSGIQLP
jgi:hypothetical protein